MPELKPITNDDDDDDMSPVEKLAAILLKLEPGDFEKVMNLIYNAEANVAEDEIDENGADPKASNAERNALGIDRAQIALDAKARRLAVDEALKNNAGFFSRWGDRIKVMG